MAKRQVFYSFHFGNDVMRVQQVRNMGVIEGNTPVSPNEWETVKKGGNTAIEKWIEDNMKYKSAVVVLVGEETHKRPWVEYEIIKAWKEKKGLVGIYIHNLNCPNNGKCSKGNNPFDQLELNNKKLSSIVKCYDPGNDAYNNIKNNIDSWVEEAIKIRNSY
ncbi:TIR domain-containing protein [Mucilaginibacter flavidus]|uniref:TIR domain-containing protein n=1 Tax=Mucilaginibacter flavidus TaxID=2949309 RepID=UPI00209365EA|nr:TIR domain-containing protein [Mucilaginibacter flavidus]MCO5950874.1 TIR domain-containing protein [Mucilaginibacter flavidus]